MEPRAPERQWSPFTGEQERVEADSDYYRDYRDDERGSREAPLGRRTARELRRGRPGLIAMIAVIVELIAIGGGGNQWVIKHLTRYAAQHPFAFPGHLVSALTVYQWRFAPQPGDRANEPLAHVALVGTVLVLTGLLVYLLCRGAITFWRAFFGTWLAVIVATLAGMVVRNLISPPPYPANFDHAAGAVFLGPDGFGAIAGAVLGVVCALFAALVAVATRRRVPIEIPATDQGRLEPAPYVPQPRARYAEYPETETASYFGSYGGNGSSLPTTPYTPSPYAAAPTVAGPAAVEREAAPPSQTADEQTTRLPRGQDAAAATTQLAPLPPEERVTPSGEDAAATSQLPTVRDEPASAVEPATSETSSGEPATSEPPAAEPAAAESGDAPTQAFPRPPDDEDLGQHPDSHDLR
ncbi:MAG TPA: hypothetical protein VFH38_02965 [Jatrophihabitans sp.]|nr:hypothetical protein [Jatrophihabitans sp.]